MEGRITFSFTFEGDVIRGTAVEIEQRRGEEMKKEKKKHYSSWISAAVALTRHDEEDGRWWIECQRINMP